MNTSLKMVLIIFFLFNSNLKAQDDVSNNKKYWYYKSRLNNDFIKVGLNSGESIPAEQRGAGNYTHKFTGDVNTFMEWGDATSYLGYYIGTLALEYYLLSQNNQNTEKTVHELFCALNAVNRLDYVAETFFGGTPLLNGYFVRDDVPDGFVKQNYQHFNYYDNNATGNLGDNQGNGFSSKFEYGANNEKSSYESWFEWKQTHNILTDHASDAPIPEMSQDQAFAIILGMAFVKKFVPTSVTDNNTVFPYSNSNNKSLATEADQITRRIIEFIRYSTDMSGNHCSTLPPQGWKIKNPVTCNPVGWNKDQNGFGDDAGWVSYALSEAGCVINNNDWGTISFSGLSMYPSVCNSYSLFDYHNNYSKTLGVTMWNATANSTLPGNGDNRLHIANLSAVCNCVYGTIADKFVDEIVTWTEQVPLLGWLDVVIGWIYNVVSSILHTFIPGSYFNNTSVSINVGAYGTTPNIDIDHAPLARKVLHGGFYQQNPDYSFKYLLNVMPCDDEFFLDNNNPQYGQIEWSGSDRIEHSRQRASPKGDDPPGTQGEYPALDYLFYHNLWYASELQNGNNPHFVDLSDTYINLNGSITNQTTFKGFETITSENSIFSTQSNDINLRAGKTISFLPGTELKASSNAGIIHAYIQNFKCATD